MPAAPTPWRLWLAAVALALGLSEVVASSARAQAPASQLGQQPEPEGQAAGLSSLPSISCKQSTKLAATAVLFHGRVIAPDTKKGILGVTVTVVGPGMSTSTQADGSFTLLIPEDQLTHKRKITLRYSFVGFVSREQRVRVNGSSVELAPVLLHYETILLGGIAFLPASDSWYRPARVVQQARLAWHTIVG
ncbi:carboxypeptidase-like regulatory domain-containing protein [Hymenobacter sp. BT18]|uniref:carboxypeptidase-like regulatory domain-containing protein n=1 Tax=Hymenobacter sp. BT18 TaxID=2835648 RepID=UPI003977D8E8